MYTNSGNYAVAQAYLSYATTQQNRTFVMTLNSACTVLGFIIGPAFAMVTTLSFLNFGVKEIKVDKLTSPGYISCLLSMIGLISLLFLKEVPHSDRNKGTVRQGKMVLIGFTSIQLLFPKKLHEDHPRS